MEISEKGVPNIQDALVQSQLQSSIFANLKGRVGLSGETKPSPLQPLNSKDAEEDGQVPPIFGKNEWGANP